MKSASVLVVPALLVGVAIGWLIKPGETAPAAEAAVAEREAKAQRPREASELGEGAKEGEPRKAKAEVRTMVIGDEAGMSEEVRKVQERMADSFAKRQTKKDEKRIAELVEKLGLDAGQEAKLRASFERKRAAMGGMFSGGGPVSVSGEDLMGPDKFDEMLGEMLSEEQSEAYEELKTVERGRKVESQALKDLAKLNQAIDLRADQKDAVYEILYEDAGSKVDRSGALNGMIGMIGDGFGLEMSGGDEMFTMTEVLADDVEISGGGGAATEQFKEQRKKAIDEKVDRMSGVLDEEQLGDYRDHLESRGSMLESIMIPAIEE